MLRRFIFLQKLLTYVGNRIIIDICQKGARYAETEKMQESV
jgi:hypothetical protein